MPRCKICKTKFEPKYFNQKSCFDPTCILEYRNKVHDKQKDEERKAQKRKDKATKEALKTLPELMAEAQKYFNTWIRQRDVGKPCISCPTILSPHIKFDAGHYFNANNHKSITFHPFNVSGQCVTCNRHKHANLIEYRKGIINRYGEEVLEELESKAYDTANYSKDEVREIKEKYKILCRKSK